MTESGRTTDCAPQGARTGPCLQGFRGGDRQGRGGAVLEEHNSAANDYPAMGKGQERPEPDRKEAVSGGALANLKCASLAVEGRVPRK